MNTAAILFAIAALGGIIMAMIRLSGRDYPPMWIAIIHGLFAAAGLVMLLTVVFGTAAPTSIQIALLLFVVAALVGFALFYHHLKGRPLPIRPWLFTRSSRWSPSLFSSLSCSAPRPEHSKC